MQRRRAIPAVTLLILPASAMAPLTSQEAAAQARRIRLEHDIRNYEV